MFTIFKSTLFQKKEVAKVKIQEFLNPHLHAMISLLESTPEFQKTKSIPRIRANLIALQALLDDIDAIKNENELRQLIQKMSNLTDKIKIGIFLDESALASAPYQAQLDFYHHDIMHSKATKGRDLFAQIIVMEKQAHFDKLMQLHSANFTKSSLLDHLKKRQGELTELLNSYANPSNILMIHSDLKLSELTHAIDNNHISLGQNLLNEANINSLTLLENVLNTRFNRANIVAPTELKTCFKA